jgi:hypothetical protein
MIIKIMGPGLQAYPFHLSLDEPCFVLAEKRDFAAKMRYDSVRLELQNLDSRNWHLAKTLDYAKKEHPS